MSVEDRLWEAADELQSRVAMADRPSIPRPVTPRRVVWKALVAAGGITVISLFVWLITVVNVPAPVADDMPPAPNVSAPVADDETPPASTDQPSLTSGVTDMFQVTDVIRDTGGRGYSFRQGVLGEGALWLISDSGIASRIDTATLQVTDLVEVGAGSLLMAPDALWVISPAGYVSRIDLVSREVTDTIQVAGVDVNLDSPVLVEGAIWVYTDRGLSRIDTRSREVTETYDSPVDVAWWAEVIDGAIWGYLPGSESLLARFDLADREFTDLFEIPCCGITEEGALVADGAIWLIKHNGWVARFDLTSLEITLKLNLGRGGISRGVVGDGAIWIPTDDGYVVRIDTASGEVTDEIAVGAQPQKPLLAYGALWVSNFGDGTVSRIDLRTRELTHTIEVGHRPETPLASNGAIWVPHELSGTVTRIEVGPGESAGEDTEPPLVNVMWSAVDGGIKGPNPWSIMAASSMLLGADGADGLWSSVDGQDWQPIFPELTDVSYAADGELAVVAGQLASGLSAIWVTLDGENWSEVDHSAFPGDQPWVYAVTQGGLVWLNHGHGESADGVVGFIVENELVDVHDAPPLYFISRPVYAKPVVETSGGITLFARNAAYSYLGGGEWSSALEVPVGGDQARVGDTILRFDHTDATCCGDTAPADTPWPLLASEDGGLTWSKLSSRFAGRRVASLELEAGTSFWVYGPQIGGGGDGIEIDSTTILWISRDGINWQPLDLGFMQFGTEDTEFGFVRVAGNFIYVSGAHQGKDWIGRVKTP